MGCCEQKLQQKNEIVQSQEYGVEEIVNQMMRRRELVNKNEPKLKGMNRIPKEYLENIIQTKMDFDLKFQDLENKRNPYIGPYWYDTDDIYLGQYRNGIREGFGIFLWQDGSYYLGQFKNDQIEGKGRLVHQEGDVYQGDWVKDHAEGYGKYYSKGIEYEGDWKKDNQEGEGFEKWPDGAQYRGEYKNGKKEGKGNFLWSNGERYVGQFFGNKMNGYGEFYKKEGSVYQGEWRNNMMHGNGKYVYRDGRVYEGEFKLEEKEGRGKMIYPDGMVVDGEWEKGLIVNVIKKQKLLKNQSLKDFQQNSKEYLQTQNDQLSFDGLKESQISYQKKDPELSF